MKTLLLCGYRSSDHSEDPLGLTRDEQGLTLIDRRIYEITALGSQAICVLAGQDADEQLRQAKAISSCELVFDTNGFDVSLATNLKSGLAAADAEAVFVLPVEIPPPPREHWHFVKEGYRQEALHTKKASLVQAMTPQGTPLHFGFPLLVTRSGNAEIRALPGLKSLSDTRLKYLHLIYPAEADLASGLKAA